MSTRAVSSIAPVLKAELKKAGSLQKLSRRLGWSAEWLSEVVRGEKQAGKELAAALGYDRVVVYIEKSKARGAGHTEDSDD